MNCQACQDLLSDYALGQLPEHERQQVADHLRSQCVSCSQALTEWQEAWAEVSRTAGEVNPPQRVGQELMDRLRTRGVVGRMESALDTRGVEEPAPAERPAWGSWRVAVAILVIAGLGALAALQSGRSEQRMALQVQQLQDQLRAARLSPQLHFASLRDTGPKPDVRGVVVWDQLAAQWHFFAFDFPAPPDGHRYQLWFVTDRTRWFPADTIRVSADGTGSVVVDVPEGARIVQAAVTLESGPPADEPTGSVRLLAEIQ